MLFIPANNSLINLDNVTNIGFIDNKLKIVFNFNCSIEAKKNNIIQLVYDYRYSSSDTREKYLNNVADILALIDSLPNWVRSKYMAHHPVNLNHVTYINSDDSRCRLIFNLTNNISRDTALGDDVIVNDFVFWDFKTIEELLEAKTTITNKITNKG